MSYELANKNCSQFVYAVAEKAPTPGGGAVAAYVGALSAALGAMTGQYTLGKRKYAEYEEDVQRAVNHLNELSEELVTLMDADAQAFEPLSRAYALPASDPTKPAVLEEATRGALEVPRKVVGCICKIVPFLEELSIKGTKMLQSDVGCAASLAAAALECAALNVFVNTASLADCEFAAAVEEDIDAQLSEFGTRAHSVYVHVNDRLRERD